MEKITKEEKKVAWKVLDALQNVIPSNQSLSTKKVFERFDLIQELKDKSMSEKQKKSYPQNRYYLTHKVKKKLNARICNNSRTVFVPYSVSTTNIWIVQLRDKYNYQIQLEII